MMGPLKVPESDIQSQFSMSRIIWIFSEFFLLFQFFKHFVIWNIDQFLMARLKVSKSQMKNKTLV